MFDCWLGTTVTRYAGSSTGQKTPPESRSRQTKDLLALVEQLRAGGLILTRVSRVDYRAVAAVERRRGFL